MTGGVEAGIIRAVASIARFVAPKVAEKRRRAMLTENLKPLLADRDALSMLDGLDERQVELFLAYLESAQFEQIALTLTLALYNGSDDSELLKVREELRLSLAKNLGDGCAQIFELTETAYNILLSAAHAVQSTYRIPPGGHASPLLLATTAKLTAASARNCELLAKSKDLAAFEDFCATLRAQAKSAYGTMKLPHAGLNRAVPYSRIFIQPDVIKYTKAKDALPTRPIARTTVAKLIATRLRFVLLGDPGAGKSTSANKLAFDIAANKISALVDRVPFLVQLRDHTDKLRNSAEATILDCIKASCNRPHHVFPSTDQIEHALLTGRSVVILDGVDELGDSSLRARLAELVEGFATRYPLTQIMVTSREVGYFDAPLNEDAFPVFQVAKFSDEQISSYSNKWFHASAGAYQLPATEMSSAFIQESGETVPDLRKNPLLLSLLCGMYASTQYLPRNRPEVYEKCAEMLFERWDRSRGVHVPLRFAADVRPAVQQLAWLLLNDNKSRVALPKSEIVAFLTDYLKSKRYEDEDEAYQAANEFIEFCAGRAWALSEVGSSLSEPLYGFTHRTFLEYFAASRLVRHAPDARTIWRLLGNKILDSSWREVAHLAVQILDRTVEDQADNLLQLILDKTPNAESMRPHYLQFCVDALRAVHPSPTVFRKLTRLTTETACFRSVQDRCPVVLQPIYLAPMFEADAALWDLLRGRHENRERAGALIAGELVAKCKERPWYDNSAALLLAALLPTAPMAQMGVPWVASEEAAKEALPWMRLFSGECPPDVEELQAHHYLGRPLFEARLDLSPLEQLVVKCFKGTYDFSATLLAREMEKTLLSTRRPWSTPVEPIMHVEGGVERPVLLPMLSLKGVPHDRTLLQFDERILGTMPPECRGLAILGMLPTLEALAEIPEGRSENIPLPPSVLVSILLRSRIEGEGAVMQHARSLLRRVELSDRVEEFVTAWLFRGISVTHPISSDNPPK